MRIKFGRPDLARYAELFDVPRASQEFSVTFLGVSTLLFDDGRSAVMTDGFFSRPSLLRVGLTTISPDPARIRSALQRLGFDPATGGRGLDAVIPVHTHFDHVLDSAAVASATGATLWGGDSAANIARGGGLPSRGIGIAEPNDTIAAGSFQITFVESAHCPPDRYPGSITTPVVPPARAAAYKCGEAWSLLIAHESGRTALVQGSAGFVSGALRTHRADVAYLGIGQLGLQPQNYIRTYWAETVTAVGARHVVLTHWDDFFRPLDQPLRALPFAGDDLDVSLRVLTTLAEQQQVTVHLPTIWQQEDPWRA